MQTILTRAELEAHDPEGGRGGRWLCPLPDCADHTDPRKHRSLHLESSGLWNCHRCKAGGQLKDNWKEKAFKSYREQEREARAKRDAEESRKLSEIGARFRALGQLRSKPLSASALALLGASGQAPAVAGMGTMVPNPEVSEPAQNGSSRTVHPELKEVLYRAGSLQGLDDARAHAFLSSRGFSNFSDTLTRARVKFAPNFGRRSATQEKRAYQGAPALVFPLSDNAGQLVAFQGRKTDPGDGLKVLTFGPKTAGVFWAPGSLAAWQEGKPLALTEAPLDALTLAVCGVPAVALCGSSAPPEFLTVGCFGRRYWLAFDADDAGDKAAQTIGANLKLYGAIVERLRPIEAKDWNEALQTRRFEPSSGGAVWTHTAEALRALMARENGATKGTGERPFEDSADPTPKSHESEGLKSEASENLTKPNISREMEQIGKENLGELQLLATKKETQLAEVGAKFALLKPSQNPVIESQLTPVLAWALTEAHHGHLPEPSGALYLPSGNVVLADGLTAWLLAAESRRVGLHVHSHTSIDCTLALGVVDRDMKHIARWARHARLWLDSPVTHAGACCLLHAAVEELRQLAADIENSNLHPFEGDLPEVEGFDTP